MKLKKQSLFLLLGVLIFLPISSSCKKRAGSPDGTISLGVMPSLEYLPIAVALDKRLMGDTPAKLRLVKFLSPNERDAAFQAGALDMEVTDFTGYLLMKRAGRAVTMPWVGRSNFILVSRFPVALEGKYAISSNTVIEYVTDLMMSYNDVDRSKCQMVEVQRVPMRIEMLLKGEIDQAVLPEPFASLAISKGLYPRDNTVRRDLYFTGFIASETLSQDLEALERIKLIYNRGVEYINTHDRSEWIDVISNELGLPLEVARRVELPTYQIVGSFNESDGEIPGLASTEMWVDQRSSQQSKK